MKPLQIGETTTYRGVELVCVEDVINGIIPIGSCDDCYLQKSNCDLLPIKFECRYLHRPDYKSVHFEVKEGEE